MDDILAANRRHWDELVHLHAASQFYDVDAFKAGKSSLPDIVLGEVGDVTGRSLLHLQCHFGMDTLSWARLGAQATGVDFSEDAIALARTLSADIGIPADFICADIYDLHGFLDRRFDVVFASFGVLCWLPDLERWGEVIGHFLRQGGTFYMMEGHPTSGIFANERTTTDLAVERSYFHSTEPERSDGPGTYADFNANLANDVTYEWQHSLSDVVNALIGAGLRIEFLHEFPLGEWQRFPFMEQGADGWWRLQDRPAIPLTFSIRATKA